MSLSSLRTSSFLVKLALSLSCQFDNHSENGGLFELNCTLATLHSDNLKEVDKGAEIDRQL